MLPYSALLWWPYPANHSNNFKKRRKKRYNFSNIHGKTFVFWNIEFTRVTATHALYHGLLQIYQRWIIHRNWIFAHATFLVLSWKFKLPNNKLFKKKKLFVVVSSCPSSIRYLSATWIIMRVALDAHLGNCNRTHGWRSCIYHKGLIFCGAFSQSDCHLILLHIRISFKNCINP